MTEDPPNRAARLDRPPDRRGGRRRVVTVAASIVVTLAVGIATVLVASGEEVVASDRSRAKAIGARATPVLAPSLSVPEAPPSNEYEDVAVESIGTIQIPAVGLLHEMYRGIWLTVLDVGPGHWPGTAPPGAYGNSVIAGHRVSSSRPFHDIHELVAGDEIIVTSDDGRFVYEVTDDEIVDPVGGMRIVDQEPGHRITIFACHPPGSDAYRYVVHGELVSDSLERLQVERPLGERAP